MKCTHRVHRWTRMVGARKFTKNWNWSAARFKKDGTIMYYVGVHRVCMGPYPPHICYFQNMSDMVTVRRGRWKDSWGKVHKYQYFYTLEKQ